jgi:hypothetical protein
MGAREVPRLDFLERLSRALRFQTRSGPWLLPDDLQLF